MKRIHWAALAVLLVVGVGCGDVWTPAQQNPAGEPGRKVCAIKLAAPTVEKLADFVFVVAKAKSTCDVPPVSHKVQLWVEKMVDGAWVQQFVKDGEPKAICEEIPPKGKTIECKYMTPVCSTGNWRTHALVTGTGPSNTPFAFEPPEKPEAKILSCPKPKKRS